MKKYLHVLLPIHTVSEANNSDHWTKKKKRHDVQKRWIQYLWSKENPQIEFPCIIVLKRFGRKILDDDNLPVSMKYVRDAIADQIFPGFPPGQADNDPRLQWKYYQEKRKEYAIEILIISTPNFDEHPFDK